MDTSKTFIHIRPNDRVFIAGQTGTGKTTLTNMLLIPETRLLIVDSKDGLHDWLTQDWSPAMADKLASGQEVRTRVVYDDDAFEAMRIAYEAGNVTVYIDEATAIAPGNHPDPSIVNLWTRGRSRQIGAWAASQRPVDVPRIFLSEAGHFFTFRLTVLDDRKRLASYTSDKLLEKPQHDYGFFYYSVKDDHAQYFKGLKQ